MRNHWCLAVYDNETCKEESESPILENQFKAFTDLHQVMKKHKGCVFVVRIPQTANQFERRAIHNLRSLGYEIRPAN